MARRVFTGRKQLILLFLAFSVIFIACEGKSNANAPVSFFDHVPSKPYNENNMSLQPVSGKTAMEYFRDERIYSGINIGNSLDAFSGSRANETGWGNPPISQELMNGIKSAGFDIVRIPVTWSGWFDNAPDYLINRYLLARVAEVVNMANNAGLKAVINLHHDGAEGAGGVNWLSMNTALRSTADYERVTFQFVQIWKQIALYFKNYGDWLIFESCNEIHDGNWGNSNYALLLPQFEILNKWNQFFTDTVRRSGGNNETRFLVIPGYVTNIRHTVGNNFVLPQDSVPGRLIVTFHYYDPYQFGIEGSRSNWGTDADKKQVDDDFAQLSKFTDIGIPVVLGECGAVLQLYPNDQAKEGIARQSRFEYLPHIFATAKKYGIVPIYWDNGATRGNGEKFGLFNRITGQPNSEDSAALIKLMIDAV